MHEVSIAEEIRDIVLEKLKEHKASKVSKIKLMIGELTTIVPEALKFALEIVSDKTAMQGAKIQIKTVKTKVKCLKCKRKFKAVDFDYACRACKSQDVRIIEGKEMIIKTIDME